MSEEQKTVRYSELHSAVVEGVGVFLLPVDHPGPFVSNTRVVLTSPVQRVAQRADGKAEFWTLNTHYVPLEE